MDAAAGEASAGDAAAHDTGAGDAGAGEVGTTEAGAGEAEAREAGAGEAEAVLLEECGGGRIAVVTLNRPQALNAMNTGLALRLADVLDEVARRASVRVVLLTGAGERAFCAGGDLKERRGMTPAQWDRQHAAFERAFRRLRRLRKPVFAAVNGVAAGGGCELAMTADFRIAAENARFGLPEGRLGIIPGCGGTQLLPRLVPQGVALQRLLTGSLIDAQEALRWGLVNRVLPQTELMPAALALAESIASNSPAALQQIKQAVRLGYGRPLQEAAEVELECYRRMVDHPDRYEGVAAFNERRAPAFRDAE